MSRFIHFEMYPLSETVYRTALSKQSSLCTSLGLLRSRSKIELKQVDCFAHQAQLRVFSGDAVTWPGQPIERSQIESIGDLHAPFGKPRVESQCNFDSSFSRNHLATRFEQIPYSVFHGGQHTLTQHTVADHLRDDNVNAAAEVLICFNFG